MVVTAPDRPVQYRLAGSSSRDRTGQWPARMRRTAEVCGRDDGERMPLAAGPGVGLKKFGGSGFCTIRLGVLCGRRG